MVTDLQVDGVYVLSVKAFKDRISHIEAELAKHHIHFEFIFDYDIPDLTPELQEKFFATDSTLRPAHESLMLKHYAAWQKGVERKQKNILVFEDDVVLKAGFAKYLAIIMQQAQTLKPGYLLFLGGANEKVPPAYFLEKGPLFENPMATAEAYVTDLEAMQQRLKWVQTHQFDRPADHQIRLIDQALGIRQYWSTTTLVEQGSILGLFQSHLDHRRQRHSLLFNRWYYYGKVFRKRVFPKIWVRCLAKLGLFKLES